MLFELHFYCFVLQNLLLLNRSSSPQIQLEIKQKIKSTFEERVSISSGCVCDWGTSTFFSNCSSTSIMFSSFFVGQSNSLDFDTINDPIPVCDKLTECENYLHGLISS